MSRRTSLSLLTLSAIFVAGCLSDAPTMPSGASAAHNFGNGLPGSHRTQQMLSGQATPLNCIPKHPAYGSATIGASGGTLIIGTHRLIVPAGALDHKVTISGTVPNDRPFEINLEPHGLRFKKAAGLILDASSCTDVPDIVYLIDQFTQSPPIVATYSSWWHTLACPIWHFSGYAVAFHEGSVDDSSAGAY